MQARYPPMESTPRAARDAPKPAAQPAPKPAAQPKPEPVEEFSLDDILAEFK